MTKASTQSQAPKSNMFAQAKASAPQPGPKVEQPKKSQKPQLAFGEELDESSVLDGFIKALKARKDAVDAIVKSKMRAAFIDVGSASGRRPDNFEGVSANATAACMLNKRGSNRPLTPDEQALCKDVGIELEALKPIDVPEAFEFNQDVLGMPGMVEKISKALAGIKLPEGVEVIKYRAAQQVVNHVASEETIEQLFATKDRTKIERAIDVVTVLALKPKLNPDVALAAMFDAMKAIVTGESASKAEDL